MPYKRIRYKLIGGLKPIFTPLIPPPPLPPVTEWGYRGVVILFNMDQAYEFTIKGTVYIETSLEGAKAKIDVILDYIPPPPPPVEKVIIVHDTIIPTERIYGNRLITYQNAGDFGDKPIMEVKSGIVVDGVNFRDGNVHGVREAVLVSGNGVLTNCTLDECERYGFVAARADGFRISNNLIKKAQNGISGSATETTSLWGKNGKITGNTINGFKQAGLKCKGWNNVEISGNFVDCAKIHDYQSFTTNFGVQFSRDAPNLNVKVLNNTFFNSTPGNPFYCEGVRADPLPTQADPQIIQTGNLI